MCAGDRVLPLLLGRRDGRAHVARGHAGQEHQVGLAGTRANARMLGHVLTRACSGHQPPRLFAPDLGETIHVPRVHWALGRASRITCCRILVFWCASTPLVTIDFVVAKYLLLDSIQSLIMLCAYSLPLVLVSELL